MKQYPNNLKFKKYHKANNFFFKKIEKKLFFPFDGEYALQCLEPGKLKFKQIEACRRTIKRGLSKQDNL
jgi:ribosomal protein L16/L10AE